MGQPVPTSLFNPEYIRGICQHVVGHEPTHMELFNKFDCVINFPDHLTWAAMEFHNLCMWGDLEVQVTALVLSWESAEPIRQEWYEYWREHLQQEDWECWLASDHRWVQHSVREEHEWGEFLTVGDGSHGSSDPNDLMSWWCAYHRCPSWDLVKGLAAALFPILKVRNTSPQVAVREFPAVLREWLLQAIDTN